ncbi:MAG TPA: aminotransferase class III-fold pyridoxal phosphate-dependent enzyme [Trueperaceae bacterium]|nr:aminotransferase class III-fold pyridoxal phosphate-dependent enzyme [Trueperaceae bacterium]
MTLARRADASDPVLPYAAADILGGLPPAGAVALEERYGNGDLVAVLDALGVGGPFSVESPWELRDARGRHLIHAAGYAALPFGEAYPPLVEFVKAFLDRSRELALPQQSASTWRGALEANLVTLLSSFAPSHEGSRVLFGNSGAEAVEAAIKLARAARPRASAFVNFGAAYHGKTHGALALTPNSEYQAAFLPLSPRTFTLPYGNLEALERTLARHAKDIAAVIVEPVQGEGGVIRPPPGFLAGLGVAARRHGVLVIADEIQTGLGRTGEWFASVAAGLDPDIVTLAKPLGGGLVPVGAVIARAEIVKALLPGLASKRHSSTFGGGSLAMAVALRSLDLIREEGLVRKAREDGAYALERLQGLQRRFPHFLQEVRGAGMLFGLQVRPVIGRLPLGARRLVPYDDDTLSQLAAALAMRAFHLGGVHACVSLNNVRTIRLTPPLNLPRHLLDELLARTERVASRHRRAWTMLPRLPLTRLIRLMRLSD